MKEINMKDLFHLRYYNEIEKKNVSWLWYPYIPFGKITIVQGDPGEGKTTLMLKIAAMMTAGKAIPTGEGNKEACNVVYQSAEDGIADTIKPRLLQAGADCSRIAFIETDEEETLSLGDFRFERAIRESKAKLLIIDPIQAFLNENSDLQKAGGLRKTCTYMAQVAEENECAIVFIGHLNKSGSSKGIYRGLGSIDLAAIARSILMVGRDKEDPNTRIMIPIKSSLAPEGKAYSFVIDDKVGLQWIGECDSSVEEILCNTNSLNRKLDRAKASLEVLLDQTDMPSVEVFTRMQAIGIGKRTIETAKQEMEIVSYKEKGEWYWHLENRTVE